MNLVSAKKTGKNVLEDYKPEELNLLLVEYFQKLTAKDAAAHYEPGTIRGIGYSVETYLKSKRYDEWKVLSLSKFALLTLSEKHCLRALSLKLRYCSW